jgi:hypothetical protein
MSDGGKGSSPRPYSVSQETYGNNFDAIFRKKTPQEIDDAKAEDDAFEYLRALADLDNKQK